MVQCSLRSYNKKTTQTASQPLYILIFFLNIKYIINSLITLVFNNNNKSLITLKCCLGKLTQNKEKLTQQFKTWPKKKEKKINFSLGRKSPKVKKYIGFERHLIYHTANVTARMRCDAVMIFTKL